MANERNYTMVILHNDNAVPEHLACPNCHNDDMDTLEINPDTGEVKCLECGKEYKI